MIDIDLLRETTQIPGAPGYEHRIRNFIEKQVADYVDELYADPMGNLVAVKKGKTEQRVMIAAHMDEISFIVSHVDDDGFIRFHSLV